MSQRDEAVKAAEAALPCYDPEPVIGCPEGHYSSCPASYHAAVAALLLDWRKRTQIEDAAAMCVFCADKYPGIDVEPTNVDKRWVHRESAITQRRCTAGPIHDLIARESGE